MGEDEFFIPHEGRTINPTSPSHPTLAELSAQMSQFLKVALQLGGGERAGAIGYRFIDKPTSISKNIGLPWYAKRNLLSKMGLETCNPYNYEVKNFAFSVLRPNSTSWFALAPHVTHIPFHVATMPPPLAATYLLTAPPTSSSAASFALEQLCPLAHIPPTTPLSLHFRHKTHPPLTHPILLVPLHKPRT
ncbi:unnamed protein product [Prunus armeniaca]|uniref:Uncharacterized protein n=1 Tax=Prunus armeniaca TaxID=36596 RepID=A0A6J5XCY4_PRUAR|nr:unnamed protein product [Prunus armeniaca]CAB4309932.1 unnamed protein product [Prunus armeniaca]